MPQPIKIDIGPGDHCRAALTLPAFSAAVGFPIGKGQRTGRLGNHPRRLEDILYCGTHRIGVNADYLINRITDDLPGMFTNSGHRHPISKKPDLGRG